MGNPFPSLRWKELPKDPSGYRVEMCDRSRAGRRLGEHQGGCHRTSGERKSGERQDDLRNTGQDYRGGKRAEEDIPASGWGPG